MTVIGIIGEYNPFHRGHSHHIHASRAQFGGESAVVCVMSGCFVQRGEAALFAPGPRAAAAVAGGADLVLELPVPWALASAEGFARGGVGLLRDIGVVDRLSFGSESGDLTQLEQLAARLSDPAFAEKLRESGAGDGRSFAARRMALLEAELGEAAKPLSQPNDILAVEYLKAIAGLGAALQPLAVPRVGAGHDAPNPAAGFCSASSLRQLWRAGEPVRPFLPEASYACLAGEALPDIERLELAMLSRLRLLTSAQAAELPDAAEGLENRLQAAAAQAASLEELLQRTKSKRYALSRLRRMCCCAALQIPAQLQKGTPPYARVLAANAVGRGLLREMGTRSRIPILTKPAAVRGLSEECQRVFQAESAAHDLWRLASGNVQDRAGGSLWRYSPIMR